MNFSDWVIVEAIVKAVTDGKKYQGDATEDDKTAAVVELVINRGAGPERVAKYIGVSGLTVKSWVAKVEEKAARRKTS